MDSDGKVDEESVSDDGLPERTYFDLSTSDKGSKIFSAHERALLEQLEDDLVLANAAWWRERLGGRGSRADLQPKCEHGTT